jgi:hypothetical protein
VIRFRVTDKGNADVGIDNLVVSNNPLGISEEVMKTAVTLYPNPNNGSFTLSVSGFIKEPLRLEIYDALGRQVYNELYRADAAQINLEDQANGIYFYRVMTASGDKLMAGGKMILKH